MRSFNPIAAVVVLLSLLQLTVAAPPSRGGSRSPSPAPASNDPFYRVHPGMEAGTRYAFREDWHNPADPAGHVIHAVSGFVHCRIIVGTASGGASARSTRTSKAEAFLAPRWWDLASDREKKPAGGEVFVQSGAWSHVEGNTLRYLGPVTASDAQIQKYAKTYESKNYNIATHNCDTFVRGVYEKIK